MNLHTNTRIYGSICFCYHFYFFSVQEQVRYQSLYFRQKMADIPFFFKSEGRKKEEGSA